MKAHTNRPRSLARMTLSIGATLSLVACGGLSSSMVLGDSKKPASQSESQASNEDTADGPSAADAADRNRRVFAGLTEEENKKNARNFKVTLRIGELSKQFEKNELFEAVEAICGIKLWDKCRVGQISGDRVMNYHPFAFQRKDGGEVHWYPDFFHDKAEPKWAKQAIVDTGMRENGDVLVGMLEERCGSPLDTKCQVRRVYNQGYVLTVRETGEVIDLWDTLREWSADL